MWTVLLLVAKLLWMLLLCPICAGEYECDRVVCPGCGCALIASSIEDEVIFGIDNEERREVQYVELCRPRSYFLAMLIKQMLEQNEVAVLIKGGHSISVLPHLAFGGELRVLVDAQQLEYAKEVYEAYFESGEEIDYMAEE
jgi:putative signal transducing protein